MTGQLFAAVVVATRTDDWTEVRRLIAEGHLSAAEARRLVREASR